MLDILDKKIVLVLNANWQAINCVSTKKAFENLFSESNGRPAALAMDLTTDIDENGDEVLVSAIPLTWDKWIELPVRENDMYINTAHRKIRVPTIIIASNFNKIPRHTPRLAKHNILERDNYTCQYTGEKLPKSQLNIDHVIPRDRGGRDAWQNLVTCRKDINSMKGNKLNHEVGLRLIREPKAPPTVPIIIKKEQAAHKDWKHFLEI